MKENLRQRCECRFQLHAFYFRILRCINQIGISIQLVTGTQEWYNQAGDFVALLSAHTVMLSCASRFIQIQQSVDVHRVSAHNGCSSTLNVPVHWFINQFINSSHTDILTSCCDLWSLSASWVMIVSIVSIGGNIPNPRNDVALRVLVLHILASTRTFGSL